MTLRDNGLMTFINPSKDKPLLELKTIQCVHCGGHFSPVKNNGYPKGGFCWRCNGPICGPNCLECIPEDLYLENIEKGRPDNYRPIIG